MPATPHQRSINCDEYLNSAYRPDLEYVDGFLVERATPTIAHSVLHMVLIQYFGSHQTALGFLPLPEARTQIVERARYRVPDILLCPAPPPAGKVMTAVPWGVIEILSPDDKLPEQLERFRDYKRIGVRHVVLMDPENRIAYRFEDGSLLQTVFSSLELPSGAVPFDSAALFDELAENLA